MTYYIDPDELAVSIDDPGTRVVDVRAGLGAAAAGREAWEREHIPGAPFADWIADWGDPEHAVEGMLARPQQFADLLSRLGITPATSVVAYDDNQLFTASRFAWALQHYGHEDVRVLNGGLPAWIAKGHPTASDAVEIEATTYPVPAPGALRAELSDVQEALEDGSTRLVDCRMDMTYDAAGAHIPGATRLPAPDLVGADGSFLDVAQVQAKAEAAGVDRDHPTILYCGGGVSASAAFVALREAGFENVRVYDGSWSEWSTHSDTPKEPNQT